MSALVRTRIGPFVQSQAISISDFTPESVVSELLPCAFASQHLPAYVCDESEKTSLSHGLSIVPRESAWQPANPGHPEVFAFVDAVGSLLAIGGWDHRWPELRPRLNLIAARGTGEPGTDEAADGS